MTTDSASPPATPQATPGTMTGPCAADRWWGRALRHPRLPLFAALLAVALMLPSLWAGLEADDHFHRVWLLADPRFPDFTGPPWDLFAFSYGDSPRVTRLRDLGIAPWWTLPQLKMAFCRPLSSVTHWLDYTLWPNAPRFMHAQNIAWYALLVSGAAVFYRRVLGVTVVAGLAALLFVVDDAHATPAGWIAGRNTLVAAAFGVWCFAAHASWRSKAWRWGAVLSPLLFALALLSAEAGVATFAYLFAHAVFLDRGTLRHRAVALLPHLMIVVVWRLVWALRGYGVYGVGAYVDPVSSPMRFFAAVLDVGPILLLGQWALPPSDLYTFYDVFRPGLSRWVWIGTAVLLIACGAVIAARLRRSREASFFATGMLLALLPICATADFPMDRLLLFVGLGAFGLLALFLQAVWRARRSPAEPPHRSLLLGAAPALAIAFVILHLVVAPVALVARAAAPAGPRDFTRQFYVDLPPDEPLAGRDIVVLNAPSGALVGMFPVMRAAENATLPRRMRMLGPSLSALTVTREDAHTLRIAPEDGFMAWSYDHLVRGLDHPFTAGERIALAGMTVEIEQTTPDGRPAVARFIFDAALDDPSLLWLKWQSGGFVETRPPSVGETMHLPRALPGI